MSDEHSHRSRVIQVSNLAPSATREQMKTFFTYIGRPEEIRLYPEIDTGSSKPKVCYIKFSSSTDAGVSLHLSNTVFVDRALIIVRVDDGKIPDESVAMRIAAPGTSIPGQLPPTNTWPATVINQVTGIGAAQVINTIDPKFSQLGVPPYPPLPTCTEPPVLDEIRRTIHASNLDLLVTPELLMEFFGKVGEVKYIRMTGEDGMPTRGALVEFTYQASVGPTLVFSGSLFHGNVLTINHATAPISKPHAASTPQVNSREIEEALKKVKDAQSLISAAVDTGDKPRRRRSRSPSRHSSRRSPIRSRRSRSRSRRSRSRSRRRSSSRNGGDTDHPKEATHRQDVAKPDSQSRSLTSTPRSRRKRSRSRHRSRSRSRRSRSPRRRRSRSRSRSRHGGDTDHPKATPRAEVAKPDSKRDRKRRRSRTPKSYRARRSTSRGRRSRSRSRDKRRSLSRSREHKKKIKSRSKSRSPKPRKDRSLSSDRDDSIRSLEKAKSRKKKSRSDSRSPPPRYRRSRSRGRRSRSKSRSGSPRRSRKKRDKDRLDSTSPSPDRGSRKKHKDKERDKDIEREREDKDDSSSRIRRDYDEEEKGFDRSDEDAARSKRRMRTPSSSEDDDHDGPPPPPSRPSASPDYKPPQMLPGADDCNTTQMDMETDSD